MEYDYPEIARDITTLIEKEVAPLVGTGKAQKITGKSVGGGFTKYIDKVAEDTVISYLKKSHIECTLITEESGVVGDGDFTIVMDPLDGTINAICGIPFYSVSLAFWGRKEKKQEKGQKYGFVKNLYTKDVYEIDNTVPVKNGKEIHPGCPEIVISGYIGEGYHKVLPLIESWRCFGSLALELCYVTEGKLAALVDLRKKARIVDIAAGWIIAEAGGVVVTDTKEEAPFTNGFFEGGKFAGKKLVCGLPDVHKKIIDALNE
ncbi:MAG: inositol monophosphatase family protein [Candidatus Methanofastidiosia archaeon]|jgi:myo-inositol-1(or 4)-monophosphatase